jgi:aspartate carbamoyltransferase catalytic subunit
MERLHHIIEAQQFDRETLEQIFGLTDKMADWMFQEGIWRRKEDNGVFSAEDSRERARMRAEMQKGVMEKMMISVFYRPSTRTRTSFETAMWTLGGKVVTSFSGEQEFSSKALEDTIIGLSLFMPDVIVLRHPLAGAAKRAMEVSYVPIINAGDGANQHPTQAIADLYTIRYIFKQIDGLSIALTGNLSTNREIRSLCYLLANYNVKIYVVAPDNLGLGQDIKDYYSANKAAARLVEVDDLRKIAAQVQVIYQSRIPSRISGGDVFFVDGQMFSHRELMDKYSINDQVLEELPKESMVMDLSFRPGDFTDINKVPLYSKLQIQYGLFVRMALLKMILDPVQSLKKEKRDGWK